MYCMFKRKSNYAGQKEPKKQTRDPLDIFFSFSLSLVFFFFVLFCLFFFKTTLTLKATRTQIPKTLNVELSRRITALSLDRWPAHSWLEWTGGTDAETGLETFKASVEDDGESLM